MAASLQGLTPGRAASLIQPYFLRRLKRDVLKELPPKIKQDTWLELDDNQRGEYEATLTGGVNELESLGAGVSKIHIFSLLTKLKRICNFAKDTNNSPKTKAVAELVEELKDNNQKVLIFSQYRDRYGVEGLETCLKRFGLVSMKGGMSDAARAVAVSSFKQDPDITVFLSTVKTGGVGLTLTEASYVIHFDHWWNPATMWQAEDRAHRYGQDPNRNVNVYSLWMQETIEEKIYDKVREKGLLFEEVINGLSEDVIDTMISTDDWLDMLGVRRQGEPRPVADRREKPVRSITSILKELFDMSPTDFEDISREVFSKIGFTNVRTTKRSHDGGIDLIGYRRSVGGSERVIAQCKRVETLGVDVARELLGVIASDQSIAKGFVVTPGSVSPECRAFCERDGRLSVLEGPVLANYILQFGTKI